MKIVCPLFIYSSKINMYIYIIYFFLIAMSGLVFSKYKAVNHAGYIIYDTIIVVSLVLLSGLRGLHVGLDTSMYYGIWNTLTPGVYNNIDTEDAEFGLFYLQAYLKQYITYNDSLLVVATLSLVPVGFVLYKHSRMLFFSFLLYYSSIVFHVLEFAAERQAVAFGCVMLAYYFLMRRKLLLFLGIMAIAFQFHHSSISFLPCYWLYDLKLNKKAILYWLMALIVCFASAASIFAYLNSFSRIDYSTSDVEAGGERLFALTIVIILIGFCNYKRLNKDPMLRVPFLLYAISPLLWPILHSNPALYRLQYYFDFFLCLWLPNLVSVLPKGNLSKYLLVSLSLFMSLYIVLVARQVDAYFPYKFFWE